MPDLDRELRGLSVEWPETPDVAAAVRARVAAEPARAGRRLVLRGRPALAYALAGLLAAAAVGLAASPSARSAILEFLGLRSVRIERREPRVPPGRGDLRLGERVSLAQARERAGFDLLVPAALGDPEAVYFASGRVSLIYDGVLVQQFRAAVDPVIGKAIGEGTRLERFRVDGDPAYFISGRVHGFSYLDKFGDAHFEDQRLAGNTLLVERDGLLLRVEGRVSRDRAVAVVRSLR